MIDLIIPTMWKYKKFPHFLKQYLNYDTVGKIIVINNNTKETPITTIIGDKITYHNSETNLFVNESWNIGVSLSSSNLICILNDDVRLDYEVTKFILKQNFSEIDIIGANIMPEKTFPFLEKIKIDKTKALGRQFKNFGCCMFIPKEKYKVIPSRYKCWYGDDYLVHHCKNIYRVPIFFEEYFQHNVSNTIKRVPEISEIIESDNMNAMEYILSGKYE